MAIQQAQPERVTARPPAEWGKDASLVPEETDGTEGEKHEAATAGMTLREITKAEKIFCAGKSKLRTLAAARIQDEELAGVLRRPCNELVKLPEDGGSYVDYAAIPLIKKWRIIADTGGLPDPVIFNELRLKHLSGLERRVAKINEELSVLHQSVDPIERQLIEEQVRRTKKVLEVFRSRPGTQRSEAALLVEQERALLDGDWHGKTEGFWFRREMKISRNAARYSVAQMVLNADNPVEMCTEAIGEVANERKYRSRGKYPDNEALFALARTLGIIFRLPDETKQRLHLTLLEAELETLRQEFSEKENERDLN